MSVVFSLLFICLDLLLLLVTQLYTYQHDCRVCADSGSPGNTNGSLWWSLKFCQCYFLDKLRYLHMSPISVFETPQPMSILLIKFAMFANFVVRFHWLTKPCPQRLAIFTGMNSILIREIKRFSRITILESRRSRFLHAPCVCLLVIVCSLVSREFLAVVTNCCRCDNYF